MTPSWGPTIIFSEKKSCFLNNLSLDHNHPNDEVFSHVESIYWTRQDALSEMKSEIFNYWSDVVGGKIVCT